MATAGIEGRGGSVVAGVLGTDRFRMWTGRSGRRHVFSRLEGPIAADDLDGAVVLIAAQGDAGRIVWVGVAAASERLPFAIGVEVFAHWLADTPAERTAIVADLGGMPGVERPEHRSIGSDLALAA